MNAQKAATPVVLDLPQTVWSLFLNGIQDQYASRPKGGSCAVIKDTLGSSRGMIECPGEQDQHFAANHSSFILAPPRVWTSFLFSPCIASRAIGGRPWLMTIINKSWLAKLHLTTNNGLPQQEQALLHHEEHDEQVFSLFGSNLHTSWGSVLEKTKVFAHRILLHDHT